LGFFLFRLGCLVTNHRFALNFARYRDIDDHSIT
jgi:hypothetical protein